MSNTKHFWAEVFMPNGRRVFSSSSKSKYTEGKVLAKQIAMGIANGAIKLAPQQGNILDAECTELTLTMRVREWDGLSSEDRQEDEGFAWATNSPAGEADDLA